jgi:hypothetical protein
MSEIRKCRMLFVKPKSNLHNFYAPLPLFDIEEEPRTPKENVTIVSIHPYITIIGVLAILTTFIFCTALVIIPLINDYSGSLKYISNGMENYCGWSGAVLGSCGIFIGVCEMVAALHTMAPSLIIAVLIQATTWCMIMGVSDTGWVFHYIALVVFLFSTVYYHNTLCYLHPFDTFIYRKVNIITIVNIVLFFISFVITSSIQNTSLKWAVLDTTVSLELTLMCCLTIQNLCVVRALNQYKNIHLIFERQDS